MSRIAIGATGLVLLRQAIAQLHGMAHEEVGVGWLPGNGRSFTS